MAYIDPNRSVAAVVLEHPQTAAVFERHHIAYCCGGSTSVADASFLRGLDLDELLGELESANASEQSDPLLEIHGVETAELVKHIIEVGGGRLAERAHELALLAQTVSEVHAGENPLLTGLAGALGELSEELDSHLREEHDRLLVPAREGCLGLRVAPLLHEVVEAHRGFGRLLDEIRVFAEDFRAPPWACPAYRRLFVGLERLERALIRRVHLVNNVLVPRLDG